MSHVKDEAPVKANDDDAPAQSTELSEEELKKVTGGTDGMRILATVAHLQAESAAADLETIVEKQRK